MMRISLVAVPAIPLSPFAETVPLSVTIKPANNLPGSFEYQTDSKTFMALLRRRTDLSGLTLDNFRRDLQISTRARLHDVKMKDEILKEIGYFID